MKLLLIELHGMDVSSIKNMPFLRSIAGPHEFNTYTGHGSSTALWTGISELQNGDYHKHFWNGSSGFWDANLFRLLRGNLYFSKNNQKKFRLSRTKNYFQDCKIFKELDFSYSGRPIIATSKSFRFDFTKDEIKRIDNFKKYWNKSLNYIRFGKIDKLGHKYGPDSEPVNEYSKILDLKLKEIYHQYNGEIIVFSLYGMIKPYKKVNVMNSLKNIKGLVFFVDDENIRIWDTGNKAAVKEALNYINSLECGSWLQEKPERKFGNYFYRVNEGVAFVPNNYVKADIKGIHSSKGWMISNCGTIKDITEFQSLIIKICNK